MKPPLLAVLALAVALLSSASAADPELTTRVLSVHPVVHSGTALSDLDLVRFFQDFGVTFPEGSSARWDAIQSQLHVRNTAANIERIEAIVSPIIDTWPSVEIDCSFVAFPIKDLDAAARKSARAAATTDDVRALWRGGAGRLVSTSKVLTRSGVEAQVKGVAEYRFLTDYEVQRDRAAVSNQTDVAQNETLAHFGTEYREAGTILTVTPTIGPDGRTIDLTLLPDLVEMTGWDEYAAAKMGNSDGGRALVRQVRQPRFRSRSLTTSVVLWDGGTAVLGGFRGKDGEETIYAFISARLVNPAGREP